MHMHDPGVYENFDVGVRPSVLSSSLNDDSRGSCLQAFWRRLTVLFVKARGYLSFRNPRGYFPNADMQVGGFPCS